MSEEERKELAHKIAVMQAALDGKEIQRRRRDYDGEWSGCNTYGRFEWSIWNYRVKPDGFEEWWEECGLRRAVLKEVAQEVWDAAVKAAKEDK